MKILRKNVDLDFKIVAVLQIEATLNGFGTLKPYLEKILKDKAAKALKERPKIYSNIAEIKSRPLTKKGQH